MRSRLAKKITTTPINKLSDYWIYKSVFGGGRDERVKKAMKMYRRYEQKQHQ